MSLLDVQWWLSYAVVVSVNLYRANWKLYSKVMIIFSLILNCFFSELWWNLKKIFDITIEIEYYILLLSIKVLLWTIRSFSLKRAYFVDTRDEEAKEVNNLVMHNHKYGFITWFDHFVAIWCQGFDMLWYESQGHILCTLKREREEQNLCNWEIGTFLSWRTNNWITFYL